MQYDVNVRYIRDGATYIAHFPEFPDLVATADSREGLRECARHRVFDRIQRLKKGGLVVPLPEASNGCDDSVQLTTVQVAKILLWNAMVAAGDVTITALAERMRIHHVSATRILSLDHPSKIEVLELAASLYRRRFKLTIESV